ncbi:MAG: NAD(P)-dependent oxidoreductase [Deltaproteobacteria bacterium]|nr:NAD(P)-dependent oxidoreductase [Deltaproteobacteria bacterium]
MATLVTGGTGFVGIHVMRQLAEHGETVVSLSTGGSLDDLAGEFLGKAEERVVSIKGDVLKLAEIRESLRRYEIKTVVHGAAVTAIGALEKEVPYQAVMVNVGGSATMLEASRLEGVRRFLYLSSATIYGSGDPAIPLREEFGVNPRGIYAITKRAAEQIVCRYLDLFPMEGAILRISTPYGPMERPTGRRELMSPIFGWCRAAAAGQEVTLSGDLQRDFTYAADTGKGIVLACEAPRLPRRIYNISSGRNISFSEALKILCSLQPKLRVRYEEVSGDQSFFRDSLRGPLDITRAREDFGFVPEYDVERGLRSYLKWLESHAA